MSELATWLRVEAVSEAHKPAPDHARVEAFYKAADEIERLRAELDKAAAIIVKVNGHNSRLLQERHNLKAKGGGHG